MIGSSAGGHVAPGSMLEELEPPSPGPSHEQRSFCEAMRPIGLPTRRALVATAPSLPFTVTETSEPSTAL